VAEIQIPGVDFGKLAQEAIAHQITKAMVGADAFVNTTIAEALSRKVDTEGKPSSRGYGVEMPFVQWVAEDLVRAAVRKAIALKVEEMRPTIEQSVAKALRAQAGTIAQGMVEAMTANVKETGRWGMNVEFVRRA
jgi:hypothetical protein